MRRLIYILLVLLAGCVSRKQASHYAHLRYLDGFASGLVACEASDDNKEQVKKLDNLLPMSERDQKR